jgi:hypothetical protein
MTPASNLRTELDQALKELEVLRKIAVTHRPPGIAVGRKTQAAVGLCALGCWWVGGLLGLLTCLLLSAAYVARNLWSLPESPPSPRQLPQLAAQIRQLERRIDELSQALTLEEQLL